MTLAPDDGLTVRLRAPIDWTHALNAGDEWQIDTDRREAADRIEALEAALREIATYDPGRSDFSAPSMIASFAQERARTLLSSESPK